MAGKKPYSANWRERQRPAGTQAPLQGGKLFRPRVLPDGVRDRLWRRRPRSVASMDDRTQSAAICHRPVELQAATESLKPQNLKARLFSQLVHARGLNQRPTSSKQHKQSNTSKATLQTNAPSRSNTRSEARVRPSANQN